MLSSKRKEIFNFVESRFDDYDIKIIHGVNGNLRRFYPFNYVVSDRYGLNSEPDRKALSNIFIYYQKEIIYDLDDEKVDFYYNLMRKIKNGEVINISNFVEFPMSGFLFYKDENRVKTVLFNKR